MKTSYNIPGRASWLDELSSDEKTRIERVIFLAIERAVKSMAEHGSQIAAAEIQGAGSTSGRFEFSRFSPDAGTYSVPSYQKQGAPVEVPVISFEPEQITVTPDRVIDDKPPFQDALVLALPGNHYVTIEAHRYATTMDPIHAVVWGKLLFGTTTWAILSRSQRSGELLYYVAGLSERLTEADLKVHPFDPQARPVPGATGEFFGRVLPSLPSGYAVESVYFPDGGRTAPTREAFTGFAGRLAVAREEPRLPLDRAKVRVFIFGNIDLLLASGDSDDLEKAANLLAELDATAFSLIDADTRVRYLTALVKAWTSEPQEKAIVEIFKSVADRSELETIIKHLHHAGIWDQLFDDLDSELWSLLIALGSRFGDKSPLSFDSLKKWLLEAKLIQPVPGVRITDKGIEISVDALAEAYEAARSFIGFIGNFFESLRMFIAHPERVVDAVGQLAKMSLTVELASLGHMESIKAIQQALAAIGEQALYALKGAAVTGMGAAIERRVRWTIIWEIASWFIGVGEIKAAVKGLGISEELAALGRILGILGLAEKAVEGELVATKLETLARLISRTSKTFAKEEDALRFISRLPPEDVARLGQALEKLELHEATDLTKLLETNTEVGDALRKAEVLSEFSRGASGLSDDVAEAFARLSRNGRLPPDEIRGLLYGLPEGQHARFARAVRSIPSSAFGPGGSASVNFLDMLAASPQRMDAMLQMGYGSFASIHRRAGSSVEKMDQYLSTLAELEQKLPPANRAIEYQRLLDQLERGDAQAWLELENARAAAERGIDTAFAEVHGLPPEGPYATTARLARGNFGERAAAEALAANGHGILIYKPSILGTNQGGIDIVSIRNGVVYLIDNKALSRGGNVGSVSALTTNFSQNLAATRTELVGMLARAGSTEERVLIQQAISAVDSGNYVRAVTNANVVRRDTQILTGITSNLQSQGIRFINVFP
ncbi:MAG TPA: hypothetical protein VKS22_11860 [Candidatus Binataceae bacterium]|nr:hypothetical protein [Candidatus Binataceae bacterium]